MCQGHLGDRHTHGLYVNIQIEGDSPSIGWAKQHVVFLLMEEELSKRKATMGFIGMIAESRVPPVTIFSAAVSPKHSFIQHLIAVDHHLLLCCNK